MNEAQAIRARLAELARMARIVDIIRTVLKQHRH